MKTIAICTIIAASIAAFQVADLCKQNYLKAEQVKAEKVLAVEAQKAERVLVLQMKIADRRNILRGQIATQKILGDINQESIDAMAKRQQEVDRQVGEYQAQIDTIQGVAGTPQPNFPNSEMAIIADRLESRIQPSSDGSNHP